MKKKHLFIEVAIRNYWLSLLLCLFYSTSQYLLGDQTITITDRKPIKWRRHLLKMAWTLKLKCVLLCYIPICLPLSGQGHFPHSPQLPAGLHPWWSPEADCGVRLLPEGTSCSAALHQTPPGRPDVSVTLLRLPEYT